MAISAHRKVVTVLFCDVVGSTALGESVDPEALQGLLAHYFERMKGIVESHGGSVEKFIGDAVMAVFGVPVAHEDDALRACRAAVEMRDALPELGVEGRIGVNAGEVLTGTEERLATGDAVNVAARLEQAAEPGEVLIGAKTLDLVGASVEIGEERLLELKGKTEPVAAFPLLSVGEVGERAHASLFVGREQELQQLADAWDRTLTGPRCELVTVVGDPGVGKSRLVAEALGLIEARVVRGRCLSYGDGITYWPVVEVVKQLDALPSDESAAKAIRSLLGDDDMVSGTDEIAWAFRKLLEEHAPLVVCFDDLQWGEETFLDLVESTALLSTGAPLLLLCMARPELLDRRPGWPATLRLVPLPEEEASALVGDAVPEEVRERIVRASGGNPLFVTEMLALAGDGTDVEVPATLWALLAARLDQLDKAERRVLERGAVEGELFHRGAVQALAPEETEVTPRLAALVRRDLIRPERPQLPQEDAYRFRHLLIRDAAYDALPKAARVDLHRRFAAWLEEHGEQLVELDEIIGYHLAQAASYSRELGRPATDLADDASRRLAAAGRRALWRGDERTAASLLERALELTRPTRFNLHLELDLADAVRADPAAAAAVASTAAQRARDQDDERGALLASVVAVHHRCSFAADPPVDQLEALAQRALPLLEEVHDHAGLVHVWVALDRVANFAIREEGRAQASEQALRHAGLAGQRRKELFGLDQALLFGPRPADKALAALDEALGDAPHPSVLLSRAVLVAMLGRFDEAWSSALKADERLRELTGHGGGHRLSEIATLAGDPEAAVRHLRDFCGWLEHQNMRSELSTYAAWLGRALCAVGKHEEAEQWAQRSQQLGDENDVLTQILWRQVQGLVCAQRHDHEQAEELARQAAAIAEPTEALTAQADAWYDLAEVLEAAGRREKAIAAWQEALERYERKQIIPLARRTRERLAAIQPTQA